MKLYTKSILIEKANTLCNEVEIMLFQEYMILNAVKLIKQYGANIYNLIAFKLLEKTKLSA